MIQGFRFIEISKYDDGGQLMPRSSTEYLLGKKGGQTIFEKESRNVVWFLTTLWYILKVGQKRRLHRRSDWQWRR